MAETGSRLEPKQPIDERVSGDPGPVPKWDLWNNQAYFICPHCWLVVGTSQPGSWTPPEEVLDHVRTCEGIRPWRMGKQALRKQKQKWMAANQQSLF